MTNKTKMSNLETFQELSIKLAIMDAKLDKLLQLIMTPEIEYKEVEISGNQDLAKSPYFTYKE